MLRQGYIDELKNRIGEYIEEENITNDTLIISAHVQKIVKQFLEKIKVIQEDCSIKNERIIFEVLYSEVLACLKHHKDQIEYNHYYFSNQKMNNSDLQNNNETDHN